MIKNKRDIPDWETLQWNFGDNWAIPLPEFPVDGSYIVGRWYIPQEMPVIPTGWQYELARGEVVCQYLLYCRLQRKGILPPGKYRDTFPVL